MSKNVPLVLRILSSSVSISKKAGSIIRNIMDSGNLNIIDKGINDLQTEADRSAQKCIIKSLETQYPKLSIFGEENLGVNYEVPSDWIITKQDESVLAQICPQTYQNLEHEDIVVWVDPLDGTSEFTQGFLSHVTVLIGLSVNGQAIGGVIHQPFFKSENNNDDKTQLGRTIWGLIGLGAFGIPHNLPPSKKLIVTTTRSHSNELINQSILALQPDEVLRVGGAGNKVLKIIEGQAHAYVFASRGCKKWDTCAPEAILHSLGGKLTDIMGNELNYLKNENFTNELGVLASYSKNNHDFYVQKIPSNIKESLIKKSKSYFKC